MSTNLGGRPVADFILDDAVWVVDAWDQVEGESYVSVWASSKAARADLSRWLEARTNSIGVVGRARLEQQGLYGGVVKRRVRA